MIDRSRSFLIYGNVLLETALKFDFLKVTFPQWLNYWGCPAILRVRGEHADASIEFLGGIEGVELRTGSTYRTWRGQAEADLKDVGAGYIIQYQEDHMVHPEAPQPAALQNAILESRPDVTQYSWFLSYEGLRARLCSDGDLAEDVLVVKTMDRSYLNTVVQDEAVYPVGLSSIFRREFYMRLLRSNRPFIRRFDPAGPFDVEQSESANWFAPLRLGLPLAEVGICIDDDHFIPGSSASSRGYFPKIDDGREYFHHPKNSLRYRFARRLDVIRVTWLRKFLSKTVSVLDYARYSLEAPILRMVDRNRSSGSPRGPRPRN